MSTTSSTTISYELTNSADNYSDSYYSDDYSDYSDSTDDSQAASDAKTDCVDAGLDANDISDAEDIWEPLTDYETKYEILSIAPHTIRNIKTHRPLTPHILPSGYVQVSLSGSNKLLHRIIAKHFLFYAYKLYTDKDADFNKLVVDHKDHNRQNNDYSNLRICTQSENNLNRDTKEYDERQYVDDLPYDSVLIRSVKVDDNTEYTFNIGKYYYSPSTEEIYSKQITKKEVKYQVLKQNTCNDSTLRVNLKPINTINKQVDVRKLVDQLNIVMN